MLTQSLLNISAYNFSKDSLAYNYAVTFHDDLLECDHQLKTQNLQLVPIKKQIQSVCF